MKTLKNKIGKIARTGALLTSLAFASGCVGMGAVMRGSDDPLTRATGVIMYHEGMHQDRMKEQKEGKPETNVNVNVGAPQDSQLYNQIKQIESYELINLDEGKKEIEIIGVENLGDYIYNKYNDEKFPERGYLFNTKINDIMRASNKLILDKDRGDKNIYFVDEKGRIYFAWPKKDK